MRQCAENVKHVAKNVRYPHPPIFLSVTTTEQPTNHANIEPSRFSNQCLDWGHLANLEFWEYQGIPGNISEYQGNQKMVMITKDNCEILGNTMEQLVL